MSHHGNDIYWGNKLEAMMEEGIMGTHYCDWHDRIIDLDYDVEHFGTAADGGIGRCLDEAQAEMNRAEAEGKHKRANPEAAKYHPEERGK